MTDVNVRSAWQDHAACIGEDPNLFFPLTGDYITARAAKAVCASCPVREQCLDYAMRSYDAGNGVTRVHGIWGGTSEVDRRVIRRARRSRRAVG